MDRSISSRRAWLAAWITVVSAGGSAQAQAPDADVQTLKKVTVAADEESITPGEPRNWQFTLHHKF